MKHLLLACALLTVGCVAEEADLPTEAIESVGSAVSTDPSSSNVYSTCLHIKKFEGIWGRIYFPAGASGCDTSVWSPLAVVFHGYGFDYDEYNYLLNHLAKNGIIAVSINTIGASSTDHVGAVAAAQGFLNGLWTTWSHRFYINPNQVALMGHSRGGGTALALADALSGNTDPWTVRAVVGLGAVNNTTSPISKEMAPAYLLIHGAEDDDETAENAFRQYDLAGTEASADWTHPDAMYKAMKLLGGGMHPGFSELWGPAEQQTVTKGYILAFLAAHLKNDTTWYDGYIRGDAVPGGWPWGDVVSQGSDGFLRRVIDNFEDGTEGSPTNGGGVLIYKVNANVLNLDPDPKSPHRTYALEMSGTAGDAYFRWSIPAAQKDASAFKWLSFRIGQRTGAPAANLAVQIRNNGGWSPDVPVIAHGKIAQPIDICTGGCPPALADHMGTVRIPLNAFGAHDNVEYVRFKFPGDASGKTFLLDSLEFSEWVLKP